MAIIFPLFLLRSDYATPFFGSIPAVILVVGAVAVLIVMIVSLFSFKNKCEIDFGKIITCTVILTLILAFALQFVLDAVY